LNHQSNHTNNHHPEPMENLLEKVGFRDRFTAEAALYPDLFPGRVTAQYKNIYRVITSRGEAAAEVSGKLRYQAGRVSDFPAVGDFVMLDRETDREGNAQIHQILTRKSVFIRKAAGTGSEEQVVAANIDTVFICMSLNQDFNLRRIERYLSIAWDSGATPVIVLTKSDVCINLPEKLTELESVAVGVEVIVTSSMKEEGFQPVKAHLQKGKTIAFVGSSGVGKSTLINRLMGEERIKTREIRKDDKGRHATTHRELFLIPGGGVVIDTPGMRELGLEKADLSKTFADIEQLAEQCRFNDCSHNREPGCAVQEAIADGRLADGRLESYRKLKKEAKYDGLNSRQIEQEKIDGDV
jgi:ribosome biogenesis GTPase / thiamine phosphate phosphatase